MIPDEELHEAYDVTGPCGPGKTFDQTIIDDPCTPATRPPAEPAEGTSSGGERCTAEGAWPCCVSMRLWAAVDLKELAEIREATLRSFLFCPWCGGKLPGGER